ncbi:DNA-directed RNA polymerase sigma-70 factor [Parapedobacter pyrenivorans]|uniref:DNA-directed RNA polymerase sigma-70 factor n=1 Tax=Parapedobacter pyrenivorans TaxID=1305674 RepID=A0A917HW83_9SPHI|nr:RNA polymerase sigma-70 factor [Parapedobacter pyrenivorans]GGG93583.1 DNA-directed RNA polymerase sigma-70 factor [Parapedobacter pyrenivorans]
MNKALLNKSIIETDAELLTRISRDDKVAFEALYKRYWRRCYTQVMKRSGDPTLAEDITQHVFVSLWENRKSITIRNVAAYLFSAVRFRFITYLKSQWYEETYTFHFLREQRDPQNPVEASVHMKELNDAIDKGVALMPPKTKAIYTLSRTEHYSVKEIASKLNLSEKAVEYHITQSLKTMRLALKDFLPIALLLQNFFE